MSVNRRIQALNELELKNVVPPSASWHTDYRDTAYIYIGGLPFDLTEGDIVTIFSQYGEPVWLKLARDKETGKSRGFAWLKYEDQRSTDLAVDNLGGADVLGRTISVDHTRYTKKDDADDEEEFNVAFDDPEQEQDVSNERKHRHHHRRRKHKDRDDDRTRSRQSPKLLEDEIERSDEDPMKDYLAKERSERHERRRSKERRNSRDRHRSKDRDNRRKYDDSERSSYRRHRHRSP